MNAEAHRDLDDLYILHRQFVETAKPPNKVVLVVNIDPQGRVFGEVFPGAERPTAVKSGRR